MHARRQLYQAKQLQAAAVQIQSMWRSYCTIRWFQALKRSVINFQAHARGYLVRVRIQNMQPKKVNTDLVASLYRACVCLSANVMVNCKSKDWLYLLSSHGSIPNVTNFDTDSKLSLGGLKISKCVSGKSQLKNLLLLLCGQRPSRNR